jgi:hypothetical protein
VKLRTEYSHDVVGVDHPDAVALAKSWEDREALLAEVRTLREENARLRRWATTWKRAARVFHGMLAAELRGAARRIVKRVRELIEHEKLRAENERLRTTLRAIADFEPGDWSEPVAWAREALEREKGGQST